MNRRLAAVKAALRGFSPYPAFIVMHDGEALCLGCTRANWRAIVEDTRCPDYRRGWEAAGWDTNWEDEFLTCAHCGELIPCAYPSDPVEERKREAEFLDSIAVDETAADVAATIEAERAEAAANVAAFARDPHRLERGGEKQ